MPRVSELGRQVVKELSCCAWHNTTSHPQITQILTSLPRTFDHFHILVQRYIGKLIRGSAGPTNLDRIDLCGRADAEDLTRIVRREITATARTQPRSFHAARLPRNHRAYRRRVPLLRYEIEPDPVVFVAALIARQHRRL